MIDSSTFDAIVVGGGIAGASCVWHLLDAGMGEVLLLEKDAPASKASGRAAGHLSTYTSRKYAPSVREYSLEFHRKLADRHDRIELREDIDHVIAQSEQGRDRLEELYEQDPKHFEFLTREEFANTETVFNTEDVSAALIYDGAVHTDPYSVTMSLVSEVQDRGATLRTEAVRAITCDGDEFVVNADGEYRSGVVINAAGAWSGHVASMVGLDLPVKARTSQIAVLEPRNPVDVPMFHYPDLGLYGRQERNGDVLVGGGTSEEIPNPNDFSTNARESYLQYVSQHSPKIVGSLDKAGLVNHWAGRCTATPDRNPLIGPTDVSGFYVCTGFNGGGIARSPFAGKLVAEYVTDTTPSFPTDPYRLERPVETDGFAVKSASTDW